jgi:trans-2,3-dihydro-3-hydroxyanthranilate isomerase
MSGAFRLVGVFGERPFEGNPAAVFLDAHRLPEDRFRALARSLGGTGSAFVLPATRPEAVALVHSFVGDLQVPFLAHTVLAALHSLDEVGRIALEPGQAVRLEFYEGHLEARLEARDGRRRTFSLRLPEAPVETIIPDLKALMKATALVHDDFDVLVPIEKSGPYLLVPLRGRESLRRLTPDERALLAYGASRGLFVFAFFCVESKSPARLALRVLAPAVSVPEDPVTGNVHAALATYLAAHRVVDWPDGAATYEVEQGDRFGRGGRLQVRFTRSGRRASGVEVVGSSATWIEGTLRTDAPR